MVGKGRPYVPHFVKEDTAATKIDASLSCGVTQIRSPLGLYSSGNKLPAKK